MRIQAFRALHEIDAGAVELTACVFTGATEADRAADAVVLVTARLAEDVLAQALQARAGQWQHAGIEEVTVIGDALAPATIAHATYAGRRYAEELDAPPGAPDAVPFERELVQPGPRMPLAPAGRHAA